MRRPVDVTRVFISCPGDVEPERDAAKRVVALVAGRWPDRVHIETYDYREESFDSLAGFQEQVPDVAGYDLVVGIVWKRIGTQLNPQKFAPEAGPHGSGTVYEVETAFVAAERDGRPDVVVFRKQAPVLYDEQTVEWQIRQRRQLLSWWAECFGEPGQPVKRASIAFDTTEDFASLFERWLEDWLRKRGSIPSGVSWDITRDGSPYPGLVSYDSRHSRVFRGRDKSIRRALALLRRRDARGTAALFVVGPSGSGKSSFVRAGLAPQLLAPAGLEGVELWRKLTLEPGIDPVSQLASRLYGAGETAPAALPELAQSQQPSAEAFVALANDSPKAVADAVAWALGKASAQARLLIIADQFEALVDQAARTPLTALFVELVRSGHTVLIATLRSDRYSLLQTDAALASLRGEDGVFDLPPPGPEELREIIDLPAAEAGLQWETGADGISLSDVLARHTASADALPLLQMTLHQLFEQRDRNSNLLTFSSYQSFGGIEGAIAARADATLASLSRGAATQLDALLRGLVADIDRRGELSLRTVARDWYAGNPPRSELIASLVRARLLVEDLGHVRVSHEALLRHWPRARDSVALRPEALRIGRVLAPLAARWQASGSDEELAVAPTLLGAAVAISNEAPGALDEGVEAFVGAAERALHAQRAAELGRARSRELAATARVESDVDQGHALALAIEAYESAPIPEAAAVLRELLHAARCRAVLDAGVQASDIAFVPGKPWIATAHRDGGVHLWDIESGSWLRTLCEARSHGESARVAIDGSGRLIAVSQGALVTVRELTTGTERCSFDCFNGVRSVAFDADGNRLVVAHGASAELRDVSSGAPLRRWNHTIIISAGFSADGKYVVGNFDDGHTVDMWSPDSDEAVFVGSTRGRTRASITDRNGRWLATASSHGVRLFFPTTSDEGRGVAVGNEHDPATCLAVVDERYEFAAGYENGLIQVWALPSVGSDSPDWRPELTQVAVLIGHRGMVMDLAWTAHGGLLASAGEDGAVRLWRRQASWLSGPKWAEFAVLPGHSRRALQVRFSGDGRHLASFGDSGEIRLWDVGMPREGPIAQLPIPAYGETQTTDLLLLDAGATRALTLNHGKVARLWDCASGQLVASLGTVDTAAFLNSRESPATGHACFSADGRLVVTAHADGTAAIWQAETGERVRVLKAASGAELTQALFDTTARRVLTASADGSVRLWDAASGRCVKKFESQFGALGAVIVLSPDCTMLAVSHADCSLTLWSVKRRQVVARIGNQGAPALLPRFSADGRTLRTSGQGDGRQTLWDAPTGELLSREDVSVDPSSIYSSWVLGERWFLVADSQGGLRVWDRQVPHAPRALRGHTGKVKAAAISPDGTLLATGSEDETTRLWNLSEGRQQALLPGSGAGTVLQVAFSPDGRRLATISDRGLLRLWCVDTDSLKQLAIQRLPRTCGRPTFG